MSRSERPARKADASRDMTLEPMDSRACPTEIAALHDRCGVYTRPQAVGWFLDKLKWTEDADLRDARLLEPAAGNGVFLEEAARRLVRVYTPQRS